MSKRKESGNRTAGTETKTKRYPLASARNKTLESNDITDII